MQNNNVKRILDFGQSIWLDLFNRRIMASGKLTHLINEYGVSGITTNPSIFEKAVTGSPDYDADIENFSHKDKISEEIFIDFAVKDIKRAADIFKEVYDRTNGVDGFVSLEVSPHLAYNTEGTIRQARELWRAVDRKNVMIKIPATAEGIPAIRKCISEGININVTLLFGLPRYKQVADAYLLGLEDRVTANQSISNIVSVASFFLSRIDVITDPLLDGRGLLELKGEVAIASAKKAYEIYKNIFSSERFKRLGSNGANRQRLLWASTSTKDPSFRDVKYIEALIGPETINTIPLEAMEAFMDHGKPGNYLENGMDKATGVLAQLNARGIDIDIITNKLEADGIKKFKTAYDKLLKAIDRKQMVYKLNETVG